MPHVYQWSQCKTQGASGEADLKVTVKLALHREVLIWRAVWGGGASTCLLKIVCPIALFLGYEPYFSVRLAWTASGSCYTSSSLPTSGLKNISRMLPSSRGVGLRLETSLWIERVVHSMGRHHWLCISTAVMESGKCWCIPLKKGRKKSRCCHHGFSQIQSHYETQVSLVWTEINTYITRSAH